MKKRIALKQSVLDYRGLSPHPAPTRLQGLTELFGCLGLALTEFKMWTASNRLGDKWAFKTII